MTTYQYILTLRDDKNRMSTTSGTADVSPGQSCDYLYEDIRRRNLATAREAFPGLGANAACVFFHPREDRLS